MSDFRTWLESQPDDRTWDDREGLDHPLGQFLTVGYVPVDIQYRATPGGSIWLAQRCPWGPTRLLSGWELAFCQAVAWWRRPVTKAGALKCLEVAETEGQLFDRHRLERELERI